MAVPVAGPLPKFYNTLTRQVETFDTLEPGKVRMYVCGPTVYDEAHLGHARCYITWDVLFRFLQCVGYDVRYVRNITDVDDKILNRAKDNGEPPTALAERFTDRFHAVMDDLNVLPPTLETKATAYVPHMIAMVQTLLDKGTAYQTSDGTVYFNTGQFPQYGQLKKQDLSDMEAGARVEVDPEKKSPLDFALWKPASLSEPLVWDAPFGAGRPGWHIECSAMNQAELGDQIDLHCGGLDLIFPHHENEIAQSEACTGHHPFSRFWMHNGFVNVSGEKMSKSLGNFSTVAELLKVYDANTLRYFILTNHYRSPVDFNEEALEGAKNRVKRIKGLIPSIIEAAYGRGESPKDYSYLSFNDLESMSIESFKDLLDIPNSLGHDEGLLGDLPTVLDHLKKLSADYKAALSDDLNTSRALAVLNELFKACTSEGAGLYKRGYWTWFILLSNFLGFDFYSKGALPNSDELKGVLEPLKLLSKSLDGFTPLENNSTEAWLEALLTYRLDARANKNWALSDQIRDQLTAMGFALKDQKDGPTTWQWQPPG